ncbi:MAG: GntR family transcriptional regulator [Desulfovibrio sp.]|nr:GntR family transcriptional regulator [Desulfovibrio sp.]
MRRHNQAYEYLKNAIISSTILPGSPIREMELAEQLQMSRTPIREAMRALEAEGILINYPAQGTFVMSLTSSDVEEIYELRSLFELWALERSLPRITDEEVASLEKSFTSSFYTFDWEACHNADRLLHALIVERSGSRRLSNFVNTLNTQTERIRRFSAKSPTRLQVSYREHMEILTLIRKRDIKSCADSLKKHLRSVANSAIEAFILLNTESGLRSELDLRNPEPKSAADAGEIHPRTA